METFPNNRMQQFPAQQPQMMFANTPPEDEQSSFDFFGILNRRKWIVFLALCIGLGLGTLVHYQSTPIYESVADIRIQPKHPLAMKVTNTELMVPNMEQYVSTRHDRIIAKQVTVESCFEKSVGLYSLPSFEEMGREDTIKFVLENLSVEPDKEDEFNYTIKFQTYNALDARTVLANIVLTYQQMLQERYKTESDGFVTLLREVKKQFEDDYKDVLARIATNSEKKRFSNH